MNGIMWIFLLLLSGIFISKNYAAVPTAGCDIVYDGYCHNLIKGSDKNWEDSQSDCVSRGGDLSTIVSYSQNILFQGKTYSSYRSCWIGLNDINNEAGTNGYNFVWVSGSGSYYRRFYPGEPNNNGDCVFFYDSNGRWYDVNCTNTYNCYFCQRPIPVIGRVSGSNYISLNNYGLSSPTTTLFCITETRESKITWYFYNTRSRRSTQITSRSTWDSTNRISTLQTCSTGIFTGHYQCRVTRKSSYVTYSATQVATSTSLPLITLTYYPATTTIHTLLNPSTNTANIKILTQSVHLQTDLNGRWRRPDNVYSNSKFLTIPVFAQNHVGNYYFYQDVNCPYTSSTWTMRIQLSIYGTNFAKLTSSNYEILSGNNIFYSDTTLVCASSSQTIQWTYKPTQSTNSQTKSSSSSPFNGVKTLNIMTTSPGYYQCNVGGYSAAIFNLDNTFRAENRESYYYTKRIDRTDIQLLCDPGSTTRPLLGVKWWHTNAGYNNPLILDHQRFTGSRTFICGNIPSDIVLYITLTLLEDPRLTISYTGSSPQSYTLLSPTVINIRIPLSSSQVRLSTDFGSGTWMLPHSTESGASYTIQEFTLDNIGRYSFSTDQNWNGINRQIFVVELGITEPEIAVKYHSTHQPIQNNTITENFIELTCFTTYQNADANSIKWYYQETIASEPQFQNALFQPQIGASSLDIAKDGFYTCHVPNSQGVEVIFSVGRHPLTNEVQSIRDEYFTGFAKETYYKGQTLIMLYRDNRKSISSIRWTTDDVKSGDANTSIEFLNPVDVSKVFSKFGAGVVMLTCFYRESPITVIGRSYLELKDTACIYITYGGFQKNFSDLTNTYFPQPQSINISILTRNIELTCAMRRCEWIIKREGVGEISIYSPEYNVDRLTIEDQGLYAIRRYTSEDRSYLTAKFFINITGYIDQRILSLNYTHIDERSITIFWELKTTLPQDAQQKFYVSYNGTKGTYTNTTRETSYNITGLIPGEIYTVHVILSYIYTERTTNKSITITLPNSQPKNEQISIVYISPVFLLPIIIITIFILIIIIFSVLRKKKIHKKLKETENTAAIAHSESTNEANADIQSQDKSKIFKFRTKRAKTKGKKHTTSYAQMNDTEVPMGYVHKPKHFYNYIDDKKLIDHIPNVSNQPKDMETTFDTNSHENEVSRSLQKSDKRTFYTNMSDVPTKTTTSINPVGIKAEKNGPKFGQNGEESIHKVGQVECSSQKSDKRTFYTNMSDNPTKNITSINLKGTKAEVDDPKIDKIEKKRIHEVSTVENSLQKIVKRTFYTNLSDNPTKNEEKVEEIKSDRNGEESIFEVKQKQIFEISKANDDIYEPLKEIRKRQFINTPSSANIPLDQFLGAYKKKFSGKSQIEEEFNNFTMNTNQTLHAEVIEGNRSENESKNPIQDVLPFEDNRVVLDSPQLESNYINASYVCGYQFIATMHPTAKTLADFLQMLYQTEPSMVVMLTTKKEKAKIIGDLSNRKAYWPNKGILDLAPFSVSITKKMDCNAFIKQELLLTHIIENKNRTVTHCISSSWNKDGTPSNLTDVVTLLVEIIHQKELEPHKPIIIHCNDSISNTGVLLSVYNAVQEMQQTKTINIYNAAKRLRRQRMQMVPTLACYNACYALMNEYCTIHL